MPLPSRQSLLFTGQKRGTTVPETVSALYLKITLIELFKNIFSVFDPRQTQSQSGFQKGHPENSLRNPENLLRFCHKTRKARLEIRKTRLDFEKIFPKGVPS